MNEFRMMQILKVAVANICDISNGYPASVGALWDNYRELEEAIQVKRKELSNMSEKVAEDLIQNKFIFFNVEANTKEGFDLRKEQVKL